jgi:hypothetical protein
VGDPRTLGDQGGRENGDGQEAQVKAKLKKILVVLGSKEARGPEIALLRLLAGALGVKLGWDFSQFVK